ncbi:ATP-binding cassette domain-containing protein [Candidatus Woesearchaeota archaeon]|nr:ATP-binding cassette domain-containing protein [Candidatus Woesearchaeota archaeon]
MEKVLQLNYPAFGSILGILGRNGIGKSTAIKILAGNIKPNLGESEIERSWEDLLKLYKGTEIYKLLERIKNGEVKVAYKPQAVDLLTKKSEGKVIDMLRKVDQRNKFDIIVKELTMESILDRELSQLSGGEMQRVAIAATILKEAIILRYYF